MNLLYNNSKSIFITANFTTAVLSLSAYPKDLSSNIYPIIYIGLLTDLTISEQGVLKSLAHITVETNMHVQFKLSKPQCTVRNIQEHQVIKSMGGYTIIKTSTLSRLVHNEYKKNAELAVYNQNPSVIDQNLNKLLNDGQQPHSSKALAVYNLHKKILKHLIELK